MEKAIMRSQITISAWIILDNRQLIVLFTLFRIYSKPMGVSTYKTAKEMSEELRRALPDVNELRKLLENETME